MFKISKTGLATTLAAAGIISTIPVQVSAVRFPASGFIGQSSGLSGRNPSRIVTITTSTTTIRTTQTVLGSRFTVTSTTTTTGAGNSGVTYINTSGNSTPSNLLLQMRRSGGNSIILTGNGGPGSILHRGPFLGRN